MHRYISIKKIFFLSSIFIGLSICPNSFINAQGVGVNSSNNPPDPSAIFDASSTTKGALIPRMTTAERNAIVSPANGLMIWNTTTKCLDVFVETSWQSLTCGCSGPPATPGTISGPTSVCQNSSGIVYFVTPAIGVTTYNWSVPPGALITAGTGTASIMVTFGTASGVVTVSALNNCGTSSANSSTITVNPYPVSTFTPTNGYTNNTITFTPTVSGATYSWTFASGTPGNSSSQNPSVTWSTPGTYSVSLTVTSNGCSSSSTNNVTLETPPKRVFVTSGSWNGNLGGLSGADAKCQTAASNAGLSGTFKAWLSDNVTAAASRLTHSTIPYKLVNGTLIANNWTDLTDGALSNPINVNENGTTISSAPYNVYSYTDVNGQPYDGNISVYYCNQWTNGTSGGTCRYGDLTRSDAAWTDINWGNCALVLRLYCFEQ